MKDWPREWKVPVIPKKLPKYKQQVEVVPSHQSTSPATKTRKSTERTKNENPRQKRIIPKTSTQEKEHTKEISGGTRNNTNVPM
jgi:hypothetical protein